MTLPNKRKLKVVNIATSFRGGAGHSAYRLHQSFLNTDILKSSFLSLDDRFPNEASNCFKYIAPQRPLHKKTVTKLDNIFFNGKIFKSGKQVRESIIGEYDLIKSRLDCEISTLPFSYADVLTQKVLLDADLINLHWVAGFLDYITFFRSCNKPIVWTLHDMNPIKGMFHYQNDEEKNSYLVNELDNHIKKIKRNAIASLKAPMEIVTPSKWLAEEAGKSPVFEGFRINVIPYSLDHQVFFYRRNIELREKLAIAPENIVFVFIAQSIAVDRKGFNLLFNALQHHQYARPVTIIAIGDLPPDIDWSEIDIRLIGAINDHSTLADYYSVADATLLPSKEDNLPNVMLESLACGTPVICFPVGGLKEYVITGKTGVLANDISVASLSEAIDYFILNMHNFDRQLIIEFAKRSFNDKKQGNDYLQVYNRLLALD